MSDEEDIINLISGDKEVDLTITGIDDLEEFITEQISDMGFPTLLRDARKNVELSIQKNIDEHKEISETLENCSKQLESLNEKLEKDLNCDNVSSDESFVSDSDDLLIVDEETSSQKISSSQSHKPVASDNTVKELDGDVIISSVQAAPPPTAKAQPLVDLFVGMKLFARKSNNIWYKGTLLEIVNEFTAPKEFWRYKIRFDYQGTKTVDGKNIAYAKESHYLLPVGSRVIAECKDEYDPNTISHFAGIVAEPPGTRNEQRYLIFFDDGYPQYNRRNTIHKVYLQSRNVWEDIHLDIKDFIKQYLYEYPERPMLKVVKGQEFKVEWAGNWFQARVQKVDASLVLMTFESDHQDEWLYRGSTRLEPLYDDLARKEAAKISGKNRRHNINVKNNKKPYIEYTSGYAANEPKSVINKNSSHQSLSHQPSKVQTQQKRSVAKKSTVSKSALSEIDGKSHEPVKKPTERDMASILQERLSASFNTDFLEGEGERRKVQLAQELSHRSTRNVYTHHKCGPACISQISDNPENFHGRNPLLKPILCGWERHMCKQKGTGRRVVFYRAPCGRRFRHIGELDSYLLATHSKMTIDLFCFDYHLHTHSEFVATCTVCDIRDISYGKESVPISCVNSIDRKLPEYVEYSTQRLPAKDVFLNLDTDFLTCCDCTDGCRDKSKCSCWKLTVEVAQAGSVSQIPTSRIGYDHRRLHSPLLTGIYECNSRCKCNYQCFNRVAQNGLHLRLQVFKTERRGWGLRCIDDIPQGGFICVYAGQLLTEQGANEDGKQFGDEYLAELDYIEVGEKVKDGYESDVSDEGIGNDSSSDDNLLDEEQKNSVHVKRGLNTASDRKPKSTKDTSTKKDSQQKLNDGDLINDMIVISDEDNDDGVNMSSNQEPPDSPAKECDTALSNLKLSGAEQPTTEDGSGDSKPLTRSQSSRFSQLPDPTSKNKKADGEQERFERLSARDLFGDNKDIYVMDAKSTGNLGRYLNHSCSPNVFVQNVFVDTHDLRFPWVSFFANQYIRAGTELTWDYNYEVGSVPDKVLYCYCGSAECRGRLL